MVKTVIKRLVALCLMALLGCDTQVAIPCIGKRGDINLDGEITAFDASLVLDIINRDFSPNDCQALAADFDKDGDIDQDDAVAIWDSAN